MNSHCPECGQLIISTTDPDRWAHDPLDVDGREPDCDWNGALTHPASLLPHPTPSSRNNTEPHPTPQPPKSTP